MVRMECMHILSRFRVSVRPKNVFMREIDKKKILRNCTQWSAGPLFSADTVD